MPYLLDPNHIWGSVQHNDRELILVISRRKEQDVLMASYFMHLNWFGLQTPAECLRIL